MNCCITVPEMTEVEEAVMAGVRSIWKVYGHKNDDWSKICSFIDVQEDIVNGMKYQMRTEEYQFAKEVSRELNFLYWLASAHQEGGDITYNPYNKDYEGGES